MRKEDLSEINERFGDILNLGRFSAFFRWTSIKDIIRLLKKDFDSISLEFVEQNTKLNNLMDTNDELNKKIELKELEIKNNQDNYNKLKVDKNTLYNDKERLNEEIKILEKKVSSNETSDKKDQEILTELKSNKKTLEDRNSDLNNRIKELEKELSSTKKELEVVKDKYEEKSRSTDEVKERYENKLLSLEEEEKKVIEKKHKDMELTWSKHEELVSLKMQEICERLAITLISPSDYEYSKRPDNSVMIANEYIIFDAKSPGNYEKLDNFSNYLKDQAEKANKYAKHEKVKKDIYFVVPENTSESLITPYYEEGNYRVHIISINSLETILRSLRKIDEYENLKDMDPEERETMFNLTGGLLHASKRKIQIDALFGTHVDSLINSSLPSLSEESISNIEKFEKASKFNPGRDEKKKRITTESTTKSVKDLQKVAFGQELNIDQEEFEKIESIPLKEKKGGKKN